MTILIAAFQPAICQYPVPMYPPIFALPPPPPIQVAVMPVFMSTSKRTTTSRTTTTTEQSIPDIMPVAVPYPIPVPMPAQIAVPAIPQPHFCMTTDPNRPKNCPPCPPCLCMPSCTPAFFSYCSPCHLQCRCRSKDDVPIPQPPVAPLPMPGPAYPMPMPVMPPTILLAPIPGPFIIRRPEIKNSDCRKTSTETDCTSDQSSSSGSTDCSSSESSDSRSRSRGKWWKRKRKGRKSWKRWKYGRKRFRGRRRGLDKDNEFVKPVLSYISKNGKIKAHRRISEKDAEELLKSDVKEKLRNKGFEVKSREESKQQRLKNDKDTQSDIRENKRDKKIVLRRSGLEHLLEKGSNEFSFRPSGGQKISNMSLRFNVS